MRGDSGMRGEGDPTLSDGGLAATASFLGRGDWADAVGERLGAACVDAAAADARSAARAAARAAVSDTVRSMTPLFREVDADDDAAEKAHILGTLCLDAPATTPSWCHLLVVASNCRSLVASLATSASLTCPCTRVSCAELGVPKWSANGPKWRPSWLHVRYSVSPEESSVVSLWGRGRMNLTLRFPEPVPSFEASGVFDIGVEPARPSATLSLEAENRPPEAENRPTKPNSGLELGKAL